jgi:hypothetical protein
LSENTIVEKKIEKPPAPTPTAYNTFSFSTHVGNLELFNQTRQDARQAYLASVSDHLVIDIPSRSREGGEFDKNTRVQYHSISLEQWDQLEKDRAVLYDMARQLQLGITDYKQYKLPVPRNYTTLYQEYRQKLDDVNKRVCKLLLEKDRDSLKLCDQRLLQDVLDAYEYKNRTGNVNLQDADDNASSTGIS